MQYMGRFILNPQQKNNGGINSDIKTNEANKLTFLNYDPSKIEIYTWLLLLNDDFQIRNGFEKKINELIELFMNSAKSRCSLHIIDILVYMAPAKNMGNKLNGQLMINADLILTNKATSKESVLESLKLNTTGIHNGITINVSGFALEDYILQLSYPKLVYSIFSHSLVNPMSRLSDLRKNSLK